MKAETRKTRGIFSFTKDDDDRWHLALKMSLLDRITEMAAFLQFVFFVSLVC